MLELRKRLQSAALPQEKNQLQRQIATTDRQIDQLVYELYDLTPEEIQIVEAAVKWLLINQFLGLPLLVSVLPQGFPLEGHRNESTIQ